MFQALLETKNVPRFKPRLYKGLVSLLQLDEDAQFTSPLQCQAYVRLKGDHPFGLDLDIVTFMGAHMPQMSFEVFIVYIRHLVGLFTHNLVTKLRVIDVPTEGSLGHSHVFFEIGFLGGQSYVSGDMPNYGEDDKFRLMTEEIFAALANIYKVEVERVVHHTSPEKLFEKLYRR